MFRYAMAIALAVAIPAMSSAETHYLAMHVDEDDAHVMNMALSNARNAAKYYAEKGDELVIEIVAYGPGLKMFVAKDSPVAERISEMAIENKNITFSACANTLRTLEKKSWFPVTLLDEANVVPSGVVRLMELQSQGYAYIRP